MKILSKYYENYILKQIAKKKTAFSCRKLHVKTYYRQRNKERFVYFSKKAPQPTKVQVL